MGLFWTFDSCLTRGMIKADKGKQDEVVAALLHFAGLHNKYCREPNWTVCCFCEASSQRALNKTASQNRLGFFVGLLHWIVESVLVSWFIHTPCSLLAAASLLCWHR